MRTTPYRINQNMDAAFEAEIREFKTAYCNETSLLVEALKSKFTDFVVDPILDVGAGFQAISVQSFPGRQVTLLDTIAYEFDSTIAATRVTGDFFDYTPAKGQRPGSVLFCHVLQYLDADVAGLYEKISSLDPQRIITVTNDNTGPFGEAVKWARKHIPASNPEQAISMEPVGFKLDRIAPVKAMLACHDFETLAYQFGRMILGLPVDVARSKALVAELASLLPKPVLQIDQTIIGYRQ